MNQKLDDICNKFIANRDTLRKNYKFQNRIMHIIGSYVFTCYGKYIDLNQLKWCDALVKQKASLVSHFRGIVRLLTSVMLAVDNNPSEKLDSALKIYKELKKQFFSSPYLPLCAMILVDVSDSGDYTRVITKAKTLYKYLRKKHPLLISQEDVVLAVLLASSPLYNDQIIYETESCYQLIQPRFYSKNSVQTLSQVLALFKGTSEEKAEKVLAVYNGLAKRGYRYGKGYELPALGMVSMLADTNSVIDDMIYVDAFLSKQKGYGGLYYTKKTKLFHAAMLVGCYYSEVSDRSIMGTITITTAITQQLAIITAVAASSAASTNVMINNT